MKPGLGRDEAYVGGGGPGLGRMDPVLGPKIANLSGIRWISN